MLRLLGFANVCFHLLALLAFATFASVCYVLLAFATFASVCYVLLAFATGQIGSFPVSPRGKWPVFPPLPLPGAGKRPVGAKIFGKTALHRLFFSVRVKKGGRSPFLPPPGKGDPAHLPFHRTKCPGPTPTCPALGWGTKNFRKNHVAPVVFFC